MVLLLLIFLALLLWMIQKELDLAVNPDPTLVGMDCPCCHAIVFEDWIVCPHCQQRLRETCHNCQKGKLINQKICPYCGVAAASVRHSRFQVQGFRHHGEPR